MNKNKKTTLSSVCLYLYVLITSDDKYAWTMDILDEC